MDTLSYSIQSILELVRIFLGSGYGGERGGDDGDDGIGWRQMSPSNKSFFQNHYRI